MASMLDIQRDIILGQLEDLKNPNDWKLLLVDDYTKRLIDNVVKEDDILNLNIVNIERVEDRRDMSPDMSAIYILYPREHIADCVIDDIQRRRYRDLTLIWTSPPGEVLDKIRATGVRAKNDILPLDFFPRESHLITFRDKKSFLTLYHPLLDRKVSDHLTLLSRRIAAVCISLGEFPLIRHYAPKDGHDAAALCYHLARFVENELVKYRDSKRRDGDWPPQTSRPPGLLVITDRSMDLCSPLLHEFTYQAMAHDVLDIKDDEKVIYHLRGDRGEDDKDAELSEKDKVWVDNRHQHMKDTIQKLQADFKKFLDDNPHFRDDGGGNKSSVSALRDMMGGLPEFTKMKEAYSLHLSMAQDCMDRFQGNKLAEVATVEQTLAVGLDEEGRKPKDTLEGVVRLLDDDAVPKLDRLRLILLWILYREGAIPDDVKRLLAHSELAMEEGEIVKNLAHLGIQPKMDLKEQLPPRVPLFPPNPEPMGEEDSPLSRYKTALASLVEALCLMTVDEEMFPFTEPLQNPNDDPMAQAGAGASLRAGGRAEPRWARAGRARPVENRQRVIVFVAGGATYSEARACYELGQQQNKDIYLVSSHMTTPRDFLDSMRHLSWSGHRLEDYVRAPRPPRPAVLSDPPPRQQPPPMQQQQGMGGPGGGMSGRQGSGPRPGAGNLPPGPGGRAPPRGGGLPSRPVAAPTQQMESMSLGGGSQSSLDSAAQRPQSGDLSGSGPAEKKKKRWFKK